MVKPNVIKILPQLIQQHFTQPIIQAHFLNVIGYGSGVFPQQQQPTNNTIDLIIITHNTKQFHSHFHSLKPTDYQGISRYLGASYVNFITSHIFPLHFNHIQINNHKVKYSIVDEKILLQDLATWEYLTLAGRLHKPVINNVLGQPLSNQILQKMNMNYEYGLKIGMLRMIRKNTKNIPLSELYSSISSLSYAGDIRYMFKVENTNKVANIVQNNLPAYNNIYLPLLRNLKDKLKPDTIDFNDRQISIRYTPELIHHLCGRLPDRISQHIDAQYQIHKGTRTEKILLGGLSELPQTLQTKIKKINRKNSLKMAVYNLLGGSLVGNLGYIWAKIKKKYKK